MSESMTDMAERQVTGKSNQRQQPSERLGALKRSVVRVIGPERYEKLRFLRREWLPHYVPNYWLRRRKYFRGERGKLEDLYVFLTNQCNARCNHCFYIKELGYVPGELKLTDYEQLAHTLPRLRLLTLTGGEATLHPDFLPISKLLARATKAERITIISNGFLPDKMERFCREILDEGIPGILDILISMDGLEETHNEIRRNPKAWERTNETLQRLSLLRRQQPDRFDLGVITIITDRNWQQLETLNEHIRTTTAARHGFEFVRGSSFSVWGLPEDAKTDYDPPNIGLPPREAWDDILETLKRINRRSGMTNHAFALTPRYTVEMLRTGKRLVDCLSAGQNVGVLYGDGGVAMCEFSKIVGRVQDYGMNFEKTWNSPAADAMRARLTQCHCTHGCYLSRNIEYSGRGMLSMLKDL